MSLAKDNSKKVRRMVQLAFLAALIVVLQVLSCVLSMYLPVSISLVLIPIVIGGMCFKEGGGAFLGGVFGVVCIVMGLASLDGGTLVLLTINPFLTCVIAMGKAIAAGALAAMVYRASMKLFKNRVYPSALLASIVAPVVNTGLFFAAALIFYKDTIVGWAGGVTSVWGIFSAVLLINFAVEFALNVILGPVIAVLLSKNKMFSPLMNR